MKRSILLIIFILSYTAGAFALDTGHDSYRSALKYIKEGNLDFAFMKFRKIIADYPDSKWAKESLFGIGEYQYVQKCYSRSLEAFWEFTAK